MKRIHFALIGCGLIAEVHAAALKELSDAALWGVYGNDIGQCEAFAAQHGCIAYPSLDALLSDGALDAVCICTPSGLHADQALAVIGAGKHVLVEKPLALHEADCNRIIDAAQAQGVCAGVVSQLRFAPVTELVKQTVQCGHLGRILHAALTMYFHRDPAYYAKSAWHGRMKYEGGGALMNQGIHGIDLLLYLMGDVKSVHGMTRTLFHDIEVEDSAVAMLEFANGALGVVEASTAVSPGFPRRLTICGTNGTIGMTENTLTTWQVNGFPLPDGYTLGGNVVSGFHAPGDITIDGHKTQLADFALAIKENRQPRVTLQDGRNAIRLISSVYRSSAANGEVIVPDCNTM